MWHWMQLSFMNNWRPWWASVPSAAFRWPAPLDPSGRHVPAPEAKELGIIDAIVEGKDLRAEAIAYAKRIADARPLPRVRDKADKLAEAKADPGMFEAMRKSIARKARNQKAPYHCIACVEAAVGQPFDEGIKTERRLFA